MKNLLFALKSRPFLFLWLAEVFSQIASNMTNFILLLVVFSLTNSNTAVSAVMLAFLFPAILFGMLAGVYVDRKDKKHVLTVTNIVRCVVLLLLAFFNKNIVGVYLLTFAVATATQFFIPAETPMIPLLVEKNVLFAANALFGIAFYGSLLVAYALSGPFLIYFGQQSAFFILAVVFLIAAIFSSLIKRTTEVKKKSKAARSITLGGEIRMAMQLIFKIKNIYHSFLLLALSQILVLVIAVIGPGFARDILKIPVDTFPLLFVTPAALGMGVGAFLLINYFQRFSKHKITTLGLFLTGLALFLLPYTTDVASKPFVLTFDKTLPRYLWITGRHIVIFLAFLSGLANALIFVPSNTLIQEETSDEVRGKIYGALSALVAVLSLLPIILVGSLSDIFGIRNVLISLSLCITLIGIIRFVALYL